MQNVDDPVDDEAVERILVQISVINVTEWQVRLARQADTYSR